MPLSGSAFWGIVIPVGDRTNLYGNPSAERGTANVVTASASVGSTAQYQQFGAWSYFMTPGAPTTAGAGFGSWSSGSGTGYTASVYFRGVANIPYRMGVIDAATLTTLKSGTLDITGGGTWHRYSVSYTENSTQNQRIYVAKRNSADTGTVYLDGFQVEAGSLTTYFDGDQEGCYWLGEPHNSPSTRSGTFRGGGSVVALEDLGLKPDDHLGIGMPPQEITSQSYALQAGAEYQRSRSGERPFVLTFKPILGTSLQGFHGTRKAIINAIKPDLLDPQQPVRFWYTGGQGTVQIDAVYAGGLELGEMDGPMAEEGAIRFVAHDPYWYSVVQQGVSLTDGAGAGGRTLIGSTNYIAYRDRIGRWGSLPGGGLNGEVMELLPVNGTVFVAGQFGSAGGTVARLIAQWSELASAWGTLTGGTLVGGDTVYALAWSPANNGTLFAGGNYNTAAGTVNSRALAAWTGAWGTLGGTVTPATLGVRALKYNTYGTLFVGGDITAAGGTTAKGIAMLTAINAWGTLTNGTLGGGAVTPLVDGIVQATPTQKVIVTGDFDTAGGTTTNNIAQWGGAWGTLSTGLDSDGQSLAVGANAVVYTGGAFGSAGGYAAPLIAQWNNVQWSPVGVGLAGGAAVRQILPLPDGNLIVVGDFNRSGSVLFPDRMAVFNGYAFLPADVDLPGANQIQAVAQSASGTTYIGGAFVGTAYSAVITQAINAGMGDAYPVFKARNTGVGTVRIFQLTNTTTGFGLYFNHVLAAGEEITLVTEPGERSLTSSFAGNIFNVIVPGSNITGMYLKSGTNYVSFFADSGSVAASMYWSARSDSVDGGTIY